MYHEIALSVCLFGPISVPALLMGLFSQVVRVDSKAGTENNQRPTSVGRRYVKPSRREHTPEKPRIHCEWKQESVIPVIVQLHPRTMCCAEVGACSILRVRWSLIPFH